MLFRPVRYLLSAGVVAVVVEVPPTVSALVESRIFPFTVVVASGKVKLSTYVFVAG